VRAAGPCTVSHVLVVGIARDGTLALVPDAHGAAVRVPLLPAGCLLNGMATGLHLAVRLGPGPREGLMTGFHRRTRRPIRLVRTALGVAVVATGFAPGGTVGAGTALYAVSTGPPARLFPRLSAVSPRSPAGSVAVAAGPSERAILRG